MERFLQDPDTIVIHHSLSPDRGLGDWQDIVKWHYIDNGWDHVGYHYGVEEMNGLLVCHKGRPEIYKGAHSIPVNSNSLAVCIIGNFDLEPPSPVILDAAAQVVRELVERYSIPFHSIKGHSETMQNRTCPGAYFDMDSFRDKVKKTTFYRPIFIK